MNQDDRNKLKQFVAENGINAELLQAEMNESEFKVEIRQME